MALSTPIPRVPTAVVVPVKAFGAAKARLADTLPPGARIELARWTATRVVRAAALATDASNVYVACDHTDVADWAAGLGANVLWGPGLGLNGAVDDAVAEVARRGARYVVISHADLVLTEPLTDLVTEHHQGEAPIVLVPDRRFDGTNVVARPVDVHVPASYGGGSFRRHLHHALASGAPVSVRCDAQLSLDLDTRADLEHPMIAPVVQPLLTSWEVST